MNLSARAAALAADAVVIGAGIVGTSTAFALGRQGVRRVVVVDAKQGPGEGTTSYSSAVLRVMYALPSAAHLALESSHFYERWYDILKLSSHHRSSGITVRRCGCMVLETPTTQPFLQQVEPTMAALSIPMERLSIEATRACCARAGWDVSVPYVPRRMDDPLFGTPAEGSVTGSAWFPSSGYISDPRRAAQDMSIAAAQLGATFLYGHDVCEIASDNREAITGVVCRVGTETVRISSPIVINCGGPYSSHINRLVFGAPQRRHLMDMKVSTRPLRTEVAVVNAPQGVDYDRHGMILADLDLGIYSRPECGQRILIGGLEASCDPLDWLQPDDDPDATSTTQLSDQADHFIHRMALRMPGLTIPPSSKRCGVVSTYDCTPDWSPIIDGSKLQGYYMSIGTSGNCFKSAPIMGEMLAERIVKDIDGLASGTGETSAAVMTHFATTFTPGEIPMKDFSRLRSAHGATSVIG